VELELLTPDQVADLLQVSRLTVYRFITAGRLPSIRIGRRLRIRSRDVDRWLRHEAVRGRSAAGGLRDRLSDRKPRPRRSHERAD
jgi:excisionase family DNA binding protein